MEVLSLMGKQGELHLAEALDATVAKLTTTKASAVEKHTPDLRPSPYAKQCFTADLKSYQNEVNCLRRKVVYAGKKTKPGRPGLRFCKTDQITFDSIRNFFSLGESAPYQSSRQPEME